MNRHDIRPLLEALDPHCKRALEHAAQRCMSEHRPEIDGANLALSLVELEEAYFLREMERAGMRCDTLRSALDCARGNEDTHFTKPTFARELIGWLAAASVQRDEGSVVSGQLLFRSLPASLSRRVTEYDESFSPLPYSSIMRSFTPDEAKSSVREYLSASGDADIFDDPELAARCRLIARDDNGDLIGVDDDGRVWSFDRGDGLTAVPVAASMRQLRSWLSAYRTLESDAIALESLSATPALKWQALRRIVARIDAGMLSTDGYFAGVMSTFIEEHAPEGGPFTVADFWSRNEGMH